MIQSCPQEIQLSAYGLGTLATQDADALEGHLAECDRCQHQFDALCQNTDGLISDLRCLAESGRLDAGRAISEVTTRVQGEVDTGNDEFVVSDGIADGRAGRFSDSPQPDPSTIGDVKRCLIDNGLIAVDDVAAVAATFVGGGKVGEAIGFVRHLVEQDLLTRFQAAEICLGRGSGLRIDDYVIEEEVGRGGMGTVFRARHATMQRTVALKVLSNRLFDQADTIERFHREAAAIGRITNANVVAAFDAGDDAGTRYIVCEFVDGVTLSGLVDANGPLPAKIAADFIRQAAMGLQAAHEQGVIHRDVKPSNLLVTRQGHVKVVDLGLVRFAEERSARGDLTERGQVLGTLDYISPEQAFGNVPVDRRSDIYNLGWTLYFLLTAKTAFSDRTQFSKLVAHRDSPIPCLKETVPAIPESIYRLFHRMVAKEPDDRPQSMAEVIEALAGVASPPTDRDIALAFPVTQDAELDSFFDDLDVKTRGLHEARRQQTQQAERRKNTIRNLAIAALTAIVLVVSGLTFYIKTSRGEIEVKFDGASDRNVEIRVYDGKQKVAVLNRQNKWTVSLRGGNYSVVIGNGKERFRIESSTVEVVPKKTTPIEIRIVISNREDEPVVAPIPARIESQPPEEEFVAAEKSQLIGEMARLDVGDSVLTMVLPPDRQTAFVAARDRNIYFIDTSRRQVVKQVVAHRGPVGLLAVSRDGTRLASYAGRFRTLRIWNARTGKRLQHIQLPTYVHCLSFGADRDSVLVGIDMRSLKIFQPNNPGDFAHFRSIMEFDAATGKAREPLTDDMTTKFNSLDCSPDGQTIVAGAGDGSVHIFDRKQPMAVRKIPGHRGPIHVVRFSDDGERLFSVGNANLILCRRLSDGRVEFGRRFRSGFTDIDISHDESAFLVRGGRDIRFFDRNEKRSVVI